MWTWIHFSDIILELRALFRTLTGYIYSFNSDNKLQTPLSELYFKSAREFDAGQGRKAIVIFVPFPQLKGWQKIQQKVIRELEKKFSGKHVVILAQVL